MSAVPVLLKIIGVCLCSLLGYIVHRSFGSWSAGEPIDQADCYFDKECHEKVDWKEVGKIKEHFFTKAKFLKDSFGDHQDGHELRAVQELVHYMHDGFVKSGVPEDRIDYILGKWLDFALPDAFYQQYAKANVVINGFACSNGYGQNINQKYAYQGETKDGRPYYRGVTSPDRFLYFDRYCADDTREPRWLVGGMPDVQRDFDLNQNDGEGCENDLSIQTESKHLPAGHQRLAWRWCEDHGTHNTEFVSIGYEISSSVQKRAGDHCSKYQMWGPQAVDGCHKCEKFYPGMADQCMTCGKQCREYCPAGSKPKCYEEDAFVGCHKKCMKPQSMTVEGVLV